MKLRIMDYSVQFRITLKELDTLVEWGSILWFPSKQQTPLKVSPRKRGLPCVVSAPRRADLGRA